MKLEKLHFNQVIGRAEKTVGTCIAEWLKQSVSQMRFLTMTSRTEFLDEIATILSARGSVYGSSQSNHERISELWSAYYGDYISPMQVSIMQLLVKVSRLAETANHQDSVKDIIGYAVIYKELHDHYDQEFGIADGI